MPSRRKFLQSAAVLSATPLAGRVAFADGKELAALDAVVIDSRHLESRTFGIRAAQWGAPLREIEGDITPLWQSELLARWRANPAAVAGLTERPALFVLERLAWDHNLRVVFEAEHEFAGNGGYRHRVLRSANVRLGTDLAAAGRGWTSVLADSLLSGKDVATRDFRPTDAAMASSLHESVKLHSWIIAPRETG